MARPLQLGVTLEGAGWHPAAWRVSSARPAELFDARYWVDLAQTAERADIDLITIEDSLTLQSDQLLVPDERTDRVRGRLDAHLLAARLATATERLGLVPTISTTHTEPFHVGVRVQSLDWVSGGRAGWRVQVARHREEADLFGPAGRDQVEGERVRARVPLFDEAAEVVEVCRRLWDSWEDGAEIRDRATGRFVDRQRIHHIDYEGDEFSVRGPSITPRSPQGQPVVAVLAHIPAAHRLAARSGDLAFVLPADSGADAVSRALDAIREAGVRAGRSGARLLVHVDLTVLIEDRQAHADRAWADLDRLATAPYRSDAPVHIGTPDSLAALLARWAETGIDGVRIRPARLPLDLDRLADDVVPRLRAAGLRPEVPSGSTTLRRRLGLHRPDSRYAPAREPSPLGVGRWVGGRCIWPRTSRG